MSTQCKHFEYFVCDFDIPSAAVVACLVTSTMNLFFQSLQDCFNFHAIPKFTHFGNINMRNETFFFSLHTHGFCFSLINFNMYRTVYTNISYWSFQSSTKFRTTHLKNIPYIPGGKYFSDVTNWLYKYVSIFISNICQIF